MKLKTEGDVNHPNYPYNRRGLVANRHHSEMWLGRDRETFDRKHYSHYLQNGTVM